MSLKLEVSLLKTCGANGLAFFGTLNEDEKKKLTYSMNRVRNGNASSNHIDYLGDGIFEIRAQTTTRWLRLLGFKENNTLKLTNGFAKDQNQTPRSEIDLAKRIRACHSDSILENKIKTVKTRQVKKKNTGR